MFVLLLVIGVLTTLNTIKIKSAATTLVEEHQNTVITSMQLSEYIKEALSAMGFYLVSQEKTYKTSYYDSINHADTLLKKLKLQKPILNDTKSKSLVNDIEHQLTLFYALQEKMFTYAENPRKNLPGLDYSSRNINPISLIILNNISNSMTSEREQDNPRTKLIDLLNDLRYSWSRIMNGVRGFLGFRSKPGLVEIESFRQQFSRQLKELEEQYGDELTFEQEEYIAELKDAYKKVGVHINNTIEEHGSDRWRKDAYTVKTEITPIVTELNKSIEELVAKQLENINALNADLIGSAENTMFVNIVMLLLSILGVVMLAYLLMTGIINPMTQAVQKGIKSISGVMDRISAEGNQFNNVDMSNNDAVTNVDKTFEMMSAALHAAVQQQQQYTEQLKKKIDTILEAVTEASNGNLTTSLELFDGNEPIDEMANSFQGMIENLHDLVKRVQESGLQVTSSTTEIAATAKQQEATVTEQAASTSEIMATVNEISATSKELVRTMQEVQEVAESAALSATDGQEAIHKMEATMEHMREATSSISAKLSVLNEKAANINTVVTTITKVADQTNLLSLNAAIEAEKAGEYGLGFAVVATEIRRLADQTAVATWDIEQMVKEMQSAVTSGVMGMDKFAEEINRGSDEISEVGEKLARVIDEVQTLTPRFETVTEGMQSQAQSGEHISTAMAQLNETAQQTAQSLHQSGRSIETLKSAAKNLQDSVSKFKVAS